jgi:hypothetical protein
MAAPKRPGKSPPTVTLESKDRALEALALRRDGYTLDEIAVKLGYANRSGPQKAIANLIAAREATTVEEYRAVAEAQLDEIVRAFMPILQSGDSENVDALKKAADAIKDTVLTRSKVRGFAAPIETKLSGALDVNLDVTKLDDHQLEKLARGELVVGLEGQGGTGEAETPPED